MTTEPPEPDPETDAVVLGGPASFDDLYAAHYADLTVQLFAYFGDRQEAQDLVQEAFCRALARWRTVSRYDDPVAWIRRVAWNLAVSRWRRGRTALGFLRRQRMAEPQVAGPGPDRVALVAALGTLPPAHRRAMVLRYLADLTIAQIAEQEGVAEGTVKSWLHRARSALATQLGPGQPSAGQPSAGQPSAGQPSAGQPSAGRLDADRLDAAETTTQEVRRA